MLHFRIENWHAGVCSKNHNVQYCTFLYRAIPCYTVQWVIVSYIFLTLSHRFGYGWSDLLNVHDAEFCDKGSNYFSKHEGVWDCIRLRPIDTPWQTGNTVSILLQLLSLKILLTVIIGRAVMHVKIGAVHNTISNVFSDSLLDVSLLIILKVQLIYNTASPPWGSKSQP